MRGIDVSYAQGRIDWQKVKEHVGFAILRAGYGKNNIDEKLVVNASACTELGIPIGLYWFSYAYTVDMAEYEAECAIHQAKKYNVTYPIAFDWEYDSAAYAQRRGVQPTKSLVMAMTIAFCKKIEEAGYIPVVYTNKDYGTRFFDINELKALGYGIWYAYYNKDNDRTDTAIWQYSSKGKMDGISGNVDMNHSYEDYSGVQTGWKKDDTGRWSYYLPDGTFVQGVWQKIDGIWYHFDPDGYMQTGWLLDEGKWYYLKADGSMAENELLTIVSAGHGAELYAFGKDGHMLKTEERGNLV